MPSGNSSPRRSLPPIEVIDVFSAAGLKKPDISVLSDEFLAEVRGLKHKNVAAELLAKLLGGEIKTRAKRQLVQSRAFSEMLKKTLNAYHNRAIATQEIIEELIRLAKEMREATNRGQDLGLNDDEIAFYDALAMNESAVKAMGSDELKVIAAELVTQVRQERDHRLDGAGKRPRQDSRHGPPHSPQARLSARLAGGGDEDGAGAGGAYVRGLGGMTRSGCRRMKTIEIIVSTKGKTTATTERSPPEERKRQEIACSDEDRIEGATLDPCIIPTASIAMHIPTTRSTRHRGGRWWRVRGWELLGQ